MPGGGAAISLFRPVSRFGASGIAARRHLAYTCTRSLGSTHASSLPTAFLRDARRPSCRPHVASPSQRRFQSNHAPSSTTNAQSSSSLNSNPEPLLDTDYLPSSTHIQPDDRHIGFLLENYGIDFGWGTSSIMKMLFEAVHSTGTEFWLSILLTGITLRFGLAPLTRLASNQSAKMRAMAPIIKPLQERMKAAGDDQAAKNEIKEKMRETYKVAGIKPYQVFYNFLQVPLGFGCWRTFSNMAASHVDGLSTGGALWFQDLTVSDPYFILPLVTVGTQFITFKAGMDANNSNLTGPAKSFQKILMFTLPAVFLPIIINAPAAIQLHFLTTASFAALLNLAFRSPATRRLLRMTAQTPNVPAAATAAAASPKVSTVAKAPPAGLRQRLQSWSATQRDSLYKTVSESSSGRVSLGKEGQARNAAQNAAQKYEAKRRSEIERARSEYQRYGQK